MPRLALLALLLALPALPAAAATGPRGSAYAAQGKAGQLAAGLRPPTLRSVSPAYGAREGGAALTIRGAGFRRTTGLSVRFAATWPKTELDVVPATYVDASTITCQAPRRDTDHTAHVSVSNDGITYSSGPMKTFGGHGTFLWYATVSPRPTGHWRLWNATLPAQGGGVLTAHLDGKFTDGKPDGTTFFRGGLLYCGFGATTRRTFTGFTEPRFVDSATALTQDVDLYNAFVAVGHQYGEQHGQQATKLPTANTLNSDAALSVYPYVADDYDTYVSTNITYELIGNTSTTFRWRKYAAGMAPAGDFSDPLPYSNTSWTELDLGVKVKFGTTVGKNLYDKWVFTAVAEVPYVSPATFHSDRELSCTAPALDSSLGGGPFAEDLDPYRVGSQQELKVSARGLGGYSAVTYYDASDKRIVIGPTETHADAVDWPHHSTSVVDTPRPGTLGAFTQDIKLHVEGYYTGAQEYTYDIAMVSDSQWVWTKYPAGQRPAGSGPTSGTRHALSTAPTELDSGVFVKWATTEGKAVGDRWTFTAYTFWSVTFSDVRPSAETEAWDIAVEGTFVCDDSATYEVVTQGDASTFKWRRWSYTGSQPSGTDGFSANVPFTLNSAINLDCGVTVRFPDGASGKKVGDSWTFDAYAGHVVTYLSKSFISPAVADGANKVGDPRVPTTSGTYLGNHTVTYTIEICNPDLLAGLPPCTTSCTNFRWMKNATGGVAPWTDAGYVDGTWSAPIAMTDTAMDIADGVQVVFGMTSGYQLGNRYYVTAKPMPTSILPIMHAYPPAAIRPTPQRPWYAMDSTPQILVSGTYEDSGDVPTHDAVVTVEFLTPDSFVYRRNNEAFLGPVTLTSDFIREPMPLYGGIGKFGLNLTFTSATGYKPGIKYLIPLKTHIPRVKRISSTSTNKYTEPSLTVPMASLTNYRNSNNGSLLGDLYPLPSNVGFANVTMWTSAGMRPGEEHNYITSETAGISNYMSTSHTPGYVYHTYPQIEITVAGEPAISAVITTQSPGSLNVSGTYAGSSSYVYEIQVPATSSTVFQWRKWRKGQGAESATNWSPSLPIKTIAAGGELFDMGLYAAFALGSYSSGSNWVFTAERGHSFRYRIVGNPTWSPETEITGTSQALASGFSVRFGALSGYSTGDVFYSTNRTVDAYGEYSGKSDAVYTLEIVGETIIDHPILLRTTGYGASSYTPPLSTTTGLAAQLDVSGTYAGVSTLTYELMVSQEGSPSRFRWRKFLVGARDGAGPFSGERIVTLSPTYIDDGLSVAWGAITGQSVGDVFTFTVHRGDTFKWRKASLSYNPSSRMQHEGKYEGTYSKPRRLFGVGLVDADLNNVGAQSQANDAVKAIGTYTGSKDYTYVVEILADGASFRWKKGPYDVSEGRTSPDSTNTRAGAYEVVPVDAVVKSSVEGGVLPSVSTHDVPDELSTWSGAVSVVVGFPVHLESGIFLLFNTASGWNHGDLFYVPCKATTHFELSDGAFVVFGSRGGYAPGDAWSFQARAGFPARGPLDGNTEITVIGSGFLPTDKLRCKLYDPGTQHEMVVPAVYDAPHQVRCVTVEHPRDTISDPEFNGFGPNLLESGGVFTGAQTTAFIVEMVTDSTFRWRAIQAGSSAPESASAWSAVTPIPHTYPTLASSPPPPPNYSGANRRRLLYAEYDDGAPPVYARDPPVWGAELAQFQGVESSHLNAMVTHLGPFFVYGTASTGSSAAYYYPVYLTKESGRTADASNRVTEHTFAEYPGTTFFMPATSTSHKAVARPPTNATIVDFGYRGIITPPPSTAAPFVPWTDLAQGVRVRFGRHEGYTPGDSWRVMAYFGGDLGRDDATAVQLDSIKPGVVKHLYVSNDAGVTWSKDESGLTRFVASDLHVSVSGNDVNGDGTYDRPFATIQRAINAALSSPRTSYRHNDLVSENAYTGPPSGRGLDAYVNRDRIVLMPGRYMGIGNVDLVPMGKMLELVSFEPNAAVIDCSGTQSGDIVYAGDMYQGGGVPTVGALRFSLVNVENCDDHRITFAYNAAAEGRSRDPFPVRPVPGKLL